MVYRYLYNMMSNTILSKMTGAKMRLSFNRKGRNNNNNKIQSCINGIDLSLKMMSCMRNLSVKSQDV